MVDSALASRYTSYSATCPRSWTSEPSNLEQAQAPMHVQASQNCPHRHHTWMLVSMHLTLSVARRRGPTAQTVHCNARIKTSVHRDLCHFAVRSTCKISQTWPVRVLPPAATNSSFLSLNLFVSRNRILDHVRSPSPNPSRSRCSLNLSTLLSPRCASSCCSPTRTDLELLRLRRRHPRVASCAPFSQTTAVCNEAHDRVIQHSCRDTTHPSQILIQLLFLSFHSCCLYIPSPSCTTTASRLPVLHTL